MKAAIVLAAGRSSRFGRADKLLAPLRGVPLLLHAICIARAAPVGRVLVATRQPARVRALVRRAGLRGIWVVPVGQPGMPLSNSLRCALRALLPIERDAFIFLGDMPDVDPRMAGRLSRRLWRGHAAVRPRHAGVPGHPVLIRAVRRRALGLDDAGFRIEKHAIGWITGDPGTVRDVDRRRDLVATHRRRAAAGQG